MNYECNKFMPLFCWRHGNRRNLEMDGNNFDNTFYMNSEDIMKKDTPAENFAGNQSDSLVGNNSSQYSTGASQYSAGASQSTYSGASQYSAGTSQSTYGGASQYSAGTSQSTYGGASQYSAALSQRMAGTGTVAHSVPVAVLHLTQ